MLASVEEGNTNPLAGQPGFTGTDGNVPGGSWGTSIVNLKKLGAGKGDRIRIRFDSAGTAVAASTAGTSTTSR